LKPNPVEKDKSLLASFMKKKEERNAFKDNVKGFIIILFSCQGKENEKDTSVSLIVMFRIVL